jgi:hypothetical protein
VFTDLSVVQYFYEPDVSGAHNFGTVLSSLLNFNLKHRALCYRSIEANECYLPGLIQSP